jgi:hypothetical protein
MGSAATKPAQERRVLQSRAAEHPVKIQLRTCAAALGLFSIALGLRLVYLEQAKSDPMAGVIHSIWDSLYYHRHALAIAGIDPARDPLGNAPYFLGPLYSYFLAGVYALFLPDPGTVKTLQAGLGAASCVLVWAIGRALFSGLAGVLGGLLFAGYGVAIYYSGILLPTNLELLLNLLFLFALVGGAPTPRRWLVAGAFGGLATAAKTNAILLVPAALVALEIAERGLPRAARLRCAGAVALGAALAIAPFTARNWIVSDHLVLMNTTGGRNLWKGNGPHANGTHVALLPQWDGARPAPEDSDVRETNLGDYLEGRVSARRAVEEDAAFRQKTLRYVLDHPGRSAALLGKKLALLANAVELGIRDRYYFALRYSSLLQLPLPGFGLIASLGLAGAAFAWRGRPRSAALYAVLAVQVVSFVLVFVLSRYRIVAAACLAVFAGELLARWLDALRTLELRRAAPSLVAAAVAAGVVNVPLQGFGREREFALAHLELGMHQIERGEHRAAIEQLERAIEHGDWGEVPPQAGVFVARERLAHAWLQAGDRERASEQVRALLADVEAAGPDYERTRRRVERLRRWIEFDAGAGAAAPEREPWPE